MGVSVRSETLNVGRWTVDGGRWTVDGERTRIVRCASDLGWGAYAWCTYLGEPGARAEVPEAPR